MRKLTFLSLIIATLILTAGCTLFGGKEGTQKPGSTSPESSEVETVESLATIQPRVEGTTVSVDCATDGLWTCNNDYGGTIKTVDYLAGSILVVEYFSDYGTVDAQIGIYEMESGKENIEVVEKITVGGGEGAILENGNNGKTYLFTIQNLEGKDDYGVKCAATIETDKFEQYKAGIEEICSSVRAG